MKLLFFYVHMFEFSEKYKFAVFLKEFRTLTTSHLPIGHSFIPFDILISVYVAWLGKESLPVKTLFANLPYSDMGIRYHFNKLVKNHWILLNNDPKDLRVKVCTPSTKLLAKMDSIFGDFKRLVISVNH
jgi:hypothetical protein